MSGINLLPWREERRRARDRQMLSTSFIIWLLCGLAVFAGYSYLISKQDYQKNRNRYLDTEIRKLDSKIKEINQLRNQKDNLITRMEVIQNLQRERTQVVHLFDDIVRKLPEGVHYASLSKKGKRFSLKGTAQSNARVSDLMNRLDSSDWFANPDLNVINIRPAEGVRLSQFVLNVSEEIIRDEDVEEVN
ncbi:MAG: PilN domain-containing protein [Pseudomonadota bacterium]